MNIHDSFQKKLKAIKFPESSKAVKVSDNGLRYSCIHIKANEHIRIRDISEIRHLRNNKMPGILARSFEQEWGMVDVQFIQSTAVCQSSCISKKSFSPLILPSIFSLEAPFDKLQLAISSNIDFLICSPPRITRTKFLELARGRGVEIGPGPSPQIINNAKTFVKYIEEKPADDWRKLYKDFDSQQEEKWDSYQIGTASNLGEPDSSLDFIFASHVFEHLHNPIGHLIYWSGKLRTGGLILLVIPQQSGTKDYAQDFTRIQNLIDEESGNQFMPTAENYYAWGKGKNKDFIDKLILEKQSIHVHTYDYDSITNLAEEIICRKVFSDYILEYLPCTKDFLIAFRK